MVSLRMARILVSGSSGLIGSALVLSLQASGVVVARLVRPGSKASTQNGQQICWSPAQFISPEEVSGFDAAIHLAGESIMGRWTEAKKGAIRDSRVVSTKNLAEALAHAKERPQVFICGSAIGFYGDRGEEVLREESPPGKGFLPDVCRDWEAATAPAANAGIRTVHLRTGIVLSSKGGALGQMLTPFKLGLGGTLADGDQWMSWIDLQDMVGGILHILKTDLLHGPVNMVAPRPVTNAEYTRTLATVLSRPAIFPIPRFVIKTAFGEMGEALLLSSLRVEPSQLVTSGYPFRFKDLRASLTSQLKA